MNRNLARSIWIYTILVISIGLLALYSASSHNVRVEQKIFYDQLTFACIGLVVMYVIGKIDYKHFYDIAYIFYIANAVLLISVLLGGRHALGATRWIVVAGISFQPSEIAKLSLIFALGRYFSNRRPNLSFGFLNRAQVLIRDLIIPFIIAGIYMVTVFKQPDLGTSILLFGIFVVMLFLSGIRIKYLTIFMGTLLSMVPFAWKILKPYQKDRLLVFLNPNIDPLGAGYTIIQSKIAVGSGQLFGKGWLAGTQNTLNFLPERHTDFIFSVIGEEWGLLGALVLIYCFFMLIMCGLKITERLKDKFGMLTCAGIVCILTLQVIINIGMVLGLFPIVGLTLPMVSYGRTSFFIFIFMMGYLINLSRERTVF